MKENAKPSIRRVEPKPRPTTSKAGAKLSGEAATAAGAKAGKPAPATKPPKPKKAKLVRDSFTIPKEEYEVLASLKQRCTALAHPSKKSELLRAGIKALAAMSDRSLLAAVRAVPSIKTGRPKEA